MVEISELKAQIRSILLSLGKTATEKEFRTAYYDIEGTSFNEVLRELKIDFYNLFLRIPDVAKIVHAYNQVFIQRVSNEATSHMENLTINKYSKRYKGQKVVTKSGAIKGRPMTNPLNTQAPAYVPYPMQTGIYQRNSVPFQPNRSYGYQNKPAQSNFNMKITPNGNNNNRNVRCYYSNNNPSTSNNKPSTSTGMFTNLSQASNIANIGNTSTQKDLNKGPEMPQTSNKRDLNKDSENLNTSSHFNKLDALIKPSRIPQTSSSTERFDELVKTSRMVPSSDSSISSISVSESTRISEDFDDTLVDKTSVSDKNESADVTLTPVPKIVEPKKILPTASTTPRPIPPVTSLLRSNKQDEVKNLSKLDELTDKVGTLKLNDTDNSGIQNVNPAMLKQRLRSMRIFREALNTINNNEETMSQTTQVTESVYDSNDIICLPEPIQNEDELFFFMKIIDVESPEKFVFQYSFDKLQNLTNKMNNFYNSLQDIKKYEVKDLIIDNIVAIRCNDLWCRGQIKSFDDSKVSVQLVDSMKIKPQTMPRKNVYHLHQKFTLDSPKSAFGKLHGLKPINGEWNMLSRAKLDSCHDKFLLATVKGIDNGVYLMSIISETRKFTRVCDMLIEEDLAKLELDDFATDAVYRSLV